MLTVISLGAGVQSSTMALMAAHGEIEPMPDCAVFADTQAEPQHVYDWLDWLETQLPFPVYRVTAGNLRDAVLNPNRGFMPVPFRLKNADGTEGLTRRQCTREYKIAPITKKIRELAGLKPRQRAKGVVAHQWIGISQDEIQRMKDAREPWLESRWPLIEKRMTRLHCLEWLRDHGYNELPRKSACTFCPYHDPATWRHVKAHEPDWWADAVNVDNAIRHQTRNASGEMFISRTLTPLADADLSDAHKDQMTLSFMDECEGMCGV